MAGYTARHKMSEGHMQIVFSSAWMQKYAPPFLPLVLELVNLTMEKNDSVIPLVPEQALRKKPWNLLSKTQRKVKQLAALKVKELPRVAEGELSRHERCVCICDTTHLLNLLSPWKTPDRRQPRSGQEDNSVGFGEEHHAGKKGLTAPSGPIFVTNTG